MFKHRQWPELSDKIIHWPEFLHGFEEQKFWTSLVSLAEISQNDPVNPFWQMQNNLLSINVNRQVPPFLQIFTFFGHSTGIGAPAGVDVDVNGAIKHVGPWIDQF